MGTSTNTPVILAIFTFYMVIFILMGFIGGDIITNTAISGPTENPGVLTFLGQISLFFQGIFFSLTNIPVWVNLILFVPLGITLFYIVLSFFRGSS